MKQRFLQSISKISLVAILGLTMFNFYIAPPPANAADGDNLIANPSFETEAGNMPANWQNGFFPEGLDVTFTYPVEGSGGVGTKAAKTTITTYGGEGDAKWYFTDVPVSPETYYVFSDKYKSNIASKVYVRYNLGNDTYSHIVLEQVQPSADWGTVISEFLTPVGVVSATIFHVIEGVGELTVDDYSLATKTNPNTFNSGMVTFTFDDGWQSVYDNAIPILDAKGYKSTQYLITDVVQDERVGTYLTPAEVLQMYNSGHDISAHTRTHTSLALPPLSSTELLKEVSGSRHDLLTRLNVKPVDTFAYTYGDYDEAAKTAVRDAGFLGARSIDEGYNEPTTDRFTLKTMSILRGGTDPVSGSEVTPTTIEAVRAAIDNAVLNKAWLIFTLHQIDDVAENVYGATPAFLQQMADYVAEKQAVVKTMSEAIRLMPGVPAKDTSAPTIAAMADINVAAQSAEGAVVTFTSPAVTDSDTGLKSFCYAPGGLVSGSTFPIGITSVTCQAMDTSGNLSTARSFNVTVADPAAPVVTISTTTSPTKLQQLSFSFTSSDPEALLESKLDSGSYATTTSPQTLSALTEGSHTFTVRATDSENRVGLAATTFVVDLTKPVISLVGSSTVNIADGSSYTDAGATATDSLDGVITGAIVKSGDTISTSTPAGTYSIHYDVTDRAGNAADRVTRTVIVGSGGQQPTNGVTNITQEGFDVAWTSAEPTFGWLVWDTASHTNASSTAAGPDKYGYANRTATTTLLTNHAASLTGLNPDTTYYFRTVTLASSTATSTVPVVSEEMNAKTLARTSSGGGGYWPTPPTHYGEQGNGNGNGNGSINWNGNGVGGNGHGDFLAEAQMITSFNGDIVLSPANTALLNRLLSGRTGISDAQRKAIAYFIQEGTWGTRKLGSGERAGVLNSFVRAFERLPENADDWEDVLKVASGRWTKKISQKTEQNAIAIFTLIYRRSPLLTNERDQMAVKLIAYGLRPGNRNMNSERASIRTFFSIFNRMPNQTGDWDIIRAIAYSGAKR